MTTTATPPAATAARVGLPAAAAATTLVLWGSAFVAIRHLGQEVEPGALTISRLAIASLVLGLMLMRRPRVWPRGREWPLVLACGVMWFGVYNLALNEAEQRIDAGTAAMLIQIGPLVVALLAAVFLDERLTPWLLVGLVVAFAGVVVIGRATDGAGDRDLWGVALTVLAAVSYAIGVVTQKPLTRRIPPFELTFLACVIGLVTALPFSGQAVTLVRTADAGTWWWIVYLGVGPTALAFSTWAYALTRMGAGRLAITTFLVPPITIALAWLLLGEVPPTAAYVGGLLCVAGVLVSRRGRPRPAAPVPSPVVSPDPSPAPRPAGQEPSDGVPSRG
ncbi:DMT family transporter [Nocardioides donggukensis]|uniref:DMT family transporter n=1 Tax=Nocardioides donggukensis TaxID=2774019 RepID=UPI00191EC2F7|nr:DMT family transporter [Nocardioides donggukensis]